MRLIALFGIVLLLSGCGFGDFLNDTHTFKSNPNNALGNSENMRRVRGLSVNEAPLTTVPGNVWPGPIPPAPTLSDLQREQNQAAPELNPILGGRSGAGEPGRRPPPGTHPGKAAPPAPAAPTEPLPNPSSNAIVVPNGNGTSTVIEPNGTIRTIPTPK